MYINGWLLLSLSYIPLHGCLSIDDHKMLGCFQFGAIMGTSVIIACQLLRGYKVLFLQ